jgi:hypothetical protein
MPAIFLRYPTRIRRKRPDISISSAPNAPRRLSEIQDVFQMHPQAVKITHSTTNNFLSNSYYPPAWDGHASSMQAGANDVSQSTLSHTISVLPIGPRDGPKRRRRYPSFSRHSDMPAGAWRLWLCSEAVRGCLHGGWKSEWPWSELVRC